MKKFMSLLLSAVLLGTMAVIPASAAEMSTQRIAYMDTKTASPEMKAEILEAREKIIFSTDGWVAEGWEGFVIDVQSGEILESVPEFHDIFPDDWEIPKEQSTSTAVETWKENVASTLASESVIFDDPVYLRKATNVPASPFFNFTLSTDHLSAYTYASSLSSSETVNIAYVNATSGTSLGYKINLYPEQAFGVVNPTWSIGGTASTINVAVKASTYSTPGYGNMVVIRSNDEISSVR